MEKLESSYTALGNVKWLQHLGKVWRFLKRLHIEFLYDPAVYIYIYIYIYIYMSFPGGSDGKESTCNMRELCSTPGSGRSPGGDNGNPLQYSCLKNPMDRGTWWSSVHGIAKSRTWLSCSHFIMWPSISTSRYQPKRYICPHKNLYVNICSSIIHNSQWESNPADEWINKMWSVHTVGLPGDSYGKESTCNAGDLDLISLYEDPLEEGRVVFSHGKKWRTDM